MHKPRKSRMGTVPIVIFRGLCISHSWGHGELGPPHFPVSRSAWWNPIRKYLYKYTIERESKSVNKHTISSLYVQYRKWDFLVFMDICEILLENGPKMTCYGMYPAQRSGPNVHHKRSFFDHFPVGFRKYP